MCQRHARATGASPQARALRAAHVTLDAHRPKARYAGFDLDASVRIGQHDRRALERLGRYLLRPPISDERVRIREDGKVDVALESPWPDGPTHLVFAPLELVEKAAALVPRPHANLLVYHGVLAGNAKGRASIVAYRRPAEPAPARANGVARAGTTQRADETERADSTSSKRAKKRSRSARDWATLMRRGLGLDVLECPRCGARLRIRAILDDPRVARPFAAKLGLCCVRAGPDELPAARLLDTHYEPDPEYLYDADA